VPKGAFGVRFLARIASWFRVEFAVLDIRVDFSFVGILSLFQPGISGTQFVPGYHFSFFMPTGRFPFVA
jgi:hypothetical protein